MATYESLTQAEKDTVALGDKWVRGAMVLLVNFVRDAEFSLNQQHWNDNVAPILATLDVNEVVPQASGHAGASDLTATELEAIETWLGGIAGDMDTNLALVLKAVGVNA